VTRVWATVFPMMEDGRIGDVIAEIERPAATEALLFLATQAAEEIEAVLQETHEVVGVGVEIRALESTEQQAVRVLRKAGIEVRFQHAGAGVWVVEAGSGAVPNRVVWVTDSGGDRAGCFFVGVYADPFAEDNVEDLSGCCGPGKLVEMVRRGLTVEIAKG
jgi:hypothetical protein